MSEVLLTFDAANTRWSYDPNTGALVNKRNMRVLSGISSSGYMTVTVRVSGKRMSFLSHRVAWLLHTGAWPVGLVDHVNRVKTDNRWANLRLASRAQNRINSRCSNSHGFRGITFRPEVSNRPWKARIQHGGRSQLIGYFETKEAAHAAYAAKAVELCGEFHVAPGSLT